MPKPKTKRSSLASTPLNWRKSDSQARRRRNALKSRDGDLLKTGRALQRIANQNLDYETRRRARTDARYFFERHKRERRQFKNGGRT